jgi:UDP-N-acetylmuramate--alanine ligase
MAGKRKPMVRTEASPERIHLIGIGGAGLSAIATVLIGQGYIVSGSDQHRSPATDRLAMQGATIHVGHAASNLHAVDVPIGALIVSSAVPSDNPEVVEAHRLGIPVYKRAEWLRRMVVDQHLRTVAVAGTHGKTTTTAMIAMMARDAGLSPTFIVGGTLEQLNTNAEAGSGDLFIVEADEYDRMFLGLEPEIAVVTVLEWDHPDCYPTFDSMVRAFEQFMASVPESGLLVGCGDEPGVQNVVARARSGGRLRAHVVTYGISDSNDCWVVDVRLNRWGAYDFRPRFPQHNGGSAVSLRVPGLHNVRNALAALVVADRLGIRFEDAAATLSGFSGVERRFEVKGEASGVLVIDDYAHHPTEIRATLATARARYPGRPVWAVFQPHTYSRTLALLEDFAGAFVDADHVVVLDIFSARESDDGLINSAQLVSRMVHPDTRYIGPLGDAADYLVRHIEPNAVLFTLGAGDGYRVGEMVLDRVRSQETGNRRQESRNTPRQPVLETNPTPGSPRSVPAPLVEALRAIFGDRVCCDEPMAAHALLGVGGPADVWLVVNTIEELVEAVTRAREYDSPLLLMGDGANLLVSDRGVRGLVLQNRCRAMEFSEEDPPHVIVQSGAHLASLARQVSRRGLSGLEWAVGVPGTVGGAIVNNAGAYGTCIADCLARAEMLTPENRREWQPVGWFDLGYRSSRLKSRLPERGSGFVVLQADLRLSRGPQAKTQEQMVCFSARRRATQPTGLSIGSMFKNPPGDYAGRLIEAAGLKGVQIGGAQVSDVHANFFINRGSAQAVDFADLIDLVRRTVRDKSGVEMELEIQKVGEWVE